MSRPKKTRVISVEDVLAKVKEAALRVPINDKTDLLPMSYVRTVVDGEAYFALAFREADWEKLDEM